MVLEVDHSIINLAKFQSLPMYGLSNYFIEIDCQRKLPLEYGHIILIFKVVLDNHWTCQYDCNKIIFKMVLENYHSIINVAKYSFPTEVWPQ